MRRLIFRLFGAIALGAGLGAGSVAMAQTETAAAAPVEARASAVSCADDDATADGLRPSCDESIAFVEVLVRDAFFVWSDESIPDAERMGRFRDVLSEGLAIVAEVVAAHHGRVMVGDSPLGGATVTVRVPADGSSESSGR